MAAMLTSDHAALVREQLDSSRRWAGWTARSATIRKVVAWVRARLVRCLLDEVSIDVTCGQICAATARRTEAMESEAEGSRNVSW